MSSKETIATVTPIKFLRHHQGHGHLDPEIPGCGEIYNKPNCFVLQYKDQLIAVVLPVSATTKKLRSIGPFRVHVLSYLSGEINERLRKLSSSFYALRFLHIRLAVVVWPGGGLSCVQNSINFSPSIICYPVDTGKVLSFPHLPYASPLVATT